MKSVYSLLVLFNAFVLNAQSIERIEPPNWWANMEANELQIMLYGKDIGSLMPSHKNTDLINSVDKTSNDNYLFINLNLLELQPGILHFSLNDSLGKKILSFDYELRDRDSSSRNRIGFNSSDVIFLITPDRFANGDSNNDIKPDLKENFIDRSDDYARHGGDIRGIIDHLDYIHNLGFTTIWPTPLLTNDGNEASYHGYAITDYYEVDPRFGLLDDYIELGKKAREKGLNLIMDQVVNHVGINHWWTRDLPAEDWINNSECINNANSVMFSNHRRTVNQDIYASKIDKTGMNDGWFVSSMPDLNQRNPLLGKYLIQNSIWWIETLGLTGIRQDTYPYADKNFMSRWAKSIMEEYPKFSIVGEEWSYNPLLVSYWQQGSSNKDNYVSNLTSTMDFPMQRAIIDGIKENESWETGLIKIYEGLANDFAYPDPERMMAFLDNHDKSRVFTEFDGNIIHTKMALAFLLTIPRIPQIYYGTEILMEDFENPGDHGLIRSDFPGGWSDDNINGFKGHGLSDDQLEFQKFLREILNYRRNSKAIHTGNTIHFAPENGIYSLFRITEEETVVLIINKNISPVNINLNRFEEIGLAGVEMKDILRNNIFIWGEDLNLPSKGVYFYTSKTE